ncbi:MAG: DUF4340 domain-containing protein, partial [Myxococcales bacterium]
EVIQAEGNFKWALEKDSFDLRDKRVAPFDDPQVRALEVRTEGRRYTVKKSGERWTLGSGEPADETTVNRLLGALRNMRANRFDTETVGPQDATRYGFLSPRAEVTLTLDPGGQMTVTFGQTEENGSKRTWVRRADATFVAEVNEYGLGDLNVSDFDLADKTVLPFEEDKVKRVRFTAGAETFTVERKAGDGVEAGAEWQLEGGAAARKWKVSNVISTLKSLKATAFATQNTQNLAQYGLEKPAKQVTLLGENDAELGTLLVGTEVNDNLFVKLANGGRIMQVEKSRLADLPGSKADVAEPPPEPAETEKKG